MLCPKERTCFENFLSFSKFKCECKIFEKMQILNTIKPSNYLLSLLVQLQKKKRKEEFLFETFLIPAKGETRGGNAFRELTSPSPFNLGGMREVRGGWRKDLSILHPLHPDHDLSSFSPLIYYLSRFGISHLLNHVYTRLKHKRDLLLANKNKQNHCWHFYLDFFCRSFILTLYCAFESIVFKRENFLNL